MALPVSVHVLKPIPASVLFQGEGSRRQFVHGLKDKITELPGLRNVLQHRVIMMPGIQGYIP
jgi:hypothetical protein